MASPSDTAPSSSPAKSISPVRRRSSVAFSDNDAAIPRHSPTLTRFIDPNEAMERQRTMDVDMAMQLSRARLETARGSPGSPGSQEDLFTSLSPHEEREIDIARGTTTERIDEPKRQTSTIDMRGQMMMQQGQDPSLLVSLNAPIHDDNSSMLFGLPTYQANAHRSTFDFGPMEEFATIEKESLGLSSPTPAVSFPLSLPRREPSSADLADAGPSDQSVRTARQRKLSQSNSHPRVPRKGIGVKLALFEGSNGHAPPLPQFSLPAPGQTATSIDFLPPAETAFTGLSQHNLGSTRPYRFSFYSNTLSATIHARSLSELPADGQTFEDLFTGTVSPDTKLAKDRTSAILGPAARSSSPAASDGARTPKPNLGRSPMNQNSRFAASEGNTWWLDVINPTDEEMRLLSKVFSIHPLTTEDIQMEETREKIELFRNYYFVCFRSFDQDQYSPTYLEPLNMYIIVFREGTLSFHFRTTPHPQNVRRRIKQLKDYISVTSDWISYALIDDITDAFGPLIQNIEYEVDSIDELVLILKEAEQSDMLRRIGRCRKKVMGLLRLMGNKADVVKGLAKRCNENWQVAPTSDIGLYLSDIQDHLITMTQNLNHYEKILSRSHSNYLAQISIEMTDANNQINDVLSKLTALGTVLIPMNLVTGLWGMNVHVPGQDVPGYKWFASIIACLAAFAVIGGYSTYKLVRR